MRSPYHTIGLLCGLHTIHCEAHRLTSVSVLFPAPECPHNITFPYAQGCTLMAVSPFLFLMLGSIPWWDKSVLTQSERSQDIAICRAVLPFCGRHSIEMEYKSFNTFLVGYLTQLISFSRLPFHHIHVHATLHIFGLNYQFCIVQLLTCECALFGTLKVATRHTFVTHTCDVL